MGGGCGVDFGFAEDENEAMAQLTDCKLTKGGELGTNRTM